MIYLLNTDEMKVEAGFETQDELNAFIVDQKPEYSHKSISNAGQLEQFFAKDLLKLRVNVGLPNIEKISGGKDKEAKRIWNAIVGSTEEADGGTENGTQTKKKGKRKAAKPKVKAQPRLGRFIKVGLLQGDFNGMTNKEAVAVIDKAKADGLINEKDAEKDTHACLLWYRNQLKDNPTVPKAAVDPEEEAAKEAEKKKKAEAAAAKRKAKAEEKKAAKAAKKDATNTEKETPETETAAETDTGVEDLMD